MQGLRLFICACGLLSLVGCTNGQSGEQNTPQATQTTTATALDNFVDAAIASTPNYMNNDVTRSMLADTIKARINHYQDGKLPFLSELPMEYEMCLPYNQYSKFAGQYVVKFSYSNRPNDRIITFQVFARMKPEQVANLVDNTKYSLDGKFLFYPDNTQEHWFELPSGRGVTDNPKISVTTEFDNSRSAFFNLGTLIMDDVRFTPTE